MFGGSWGSTLALAYAEAHPERVTELVLRGIFLFDQYEIDWMYKEGGASQVYPDKFDEFIAPDSRGRARRPRRGLSQAADQRRQGRAARRRQGVEQVGRRHRHPAARAPTTIEHFTSPDVAVAVARIENHYMANHGWLEEGQLLSDATKLKGIPGVIVQGRHDTCTPPVARRGSSSRPGPRSSCNIIPDGGHLFSEPGILDGLVRATDRFAGL